MEKEDIRIIFRSDKLTKYKLTNIAKDKGIKLSELMKRITRDYIKTYEERGY